ncbi:hypothetical protein [Enterococcus sp.]|uniref:HIT family protein n=1 Tax=Enterococcus sp. TaxID=35783 RepID=UPI0025BC7E00|nr:hypothetical protein [Enterococcus sp.]
MDWRNDRIKACQTGTNPMLIKELIGGFAVFGDTQFLPGYCVLLPKKTVGSLNEFSLKERQEFLVSMSILGDAILAACSPLRVNYDILGNTDQFLHAHVFPRYLWEKEERRSKPVWLYSASHWTSPLDAYDEEKHLVIRQRIAAYLNDFAG